MTFVVFCRGDLISCKIEDLLKIRFADNGKLQVNLIAEVIFPNIELSKSALPYGHVLNTTTAHRYVVMKNSSKAAVNYKWYIQPAGRLLYSRGTNVGYHGIESCFVRCPAMILSPVPCLKTLLYAKP